MASKPQTVGSIPNMVKMKWVSLFLLEQVHQAQFSVGSSEQADFQVFVGRDLRLVVSKDIFSKSR